VFRLYAKDEINQAGGECVFVRCKHSLRDKCERKKHERSLLTVFSDAGSTPAASTICIFFIISSLPSTTPTERTLYSLYDTLKPAVST